MQSVQNDAACTGENPPNAPRRFAGGRAWGGYIGIGDVTEKPRNTGWITGINGRCPAYANDGWRPKEKRRSANKRD